MIKIGNKVLKGVVLSMNCLLAFAFSNALATTQPPPSAPAPAATHVIIPNPPNIDAKGYILMDANTGAILAGRSIDTRMAPASLTKLMTLYQVACALKDQRVHLSDKVTISEKAWRTGGSKMFVKIGDKVPLTDLIQGIAVVSGNDACVAVAEHLAGSEDSFADLMNRSANLLGMTNTHYTDATGLPDPKLYTTPRDLSSLTRAIVNQFPEYYSWYSQKWFLYNGIKQPNRDLLLWRDSSVEGMKTGHTEDAGYCLVSTASRKGMRLISVVMGSKSSHSRADASLALLNYGFRFYESQKLYAANQPIKEARIYYGKDKMLPIGLLKNLYVTLPAGAKSTQLKTEISVNDNLKAPIQKGASVGMLTLKLNDKIYLSQPLVALKDIPKGGIFAQLKDRIASMLKI